MKDKIKTKLEVISIRFLRGFASGFFSSALAIGVFVGNSFTDFQVWLGLFLMAGLSGGLTGGCMALDKYFRWKE